MVKKSSFLRKKVSRGGELRAVQQEEKASEGTALVVDAATSPTASRSMTVVLLATCHFVMTQRTILAVKYRVPVRHPARSRRIHGF
jgi:hypothetical protein